MKNIQVTDEQYEILKKMSENMGKQNNRCTRLPLFCVAEYYKKVVPEDCGGDEWDAVDEEGNVIFDNSDDLRKWWSNKKEILDTYDITEEQYNDVAEERDYFLKDEIVSLLNLRIIPYEKDRRLINGQVYFTEEECERHIKLNHYHYHEPHSYVVGAWRNIEMETLLDVVHSISNEGKAHR